MDYHHRSPTRTSGMASTTYNMDRNAIISKLRAELTQSRKSLQVAMDDATIKDATIDQLRITLASFEKDLALRTQEKEDTNKEKYILRILG